MKRFILHIYRAVIPETVRAFLMPPFIRKLIHHVFKSRLRNQIHEAESQMQAENWPEAIQCWQDLLNNYGKNAPPGIYVKLARAYRRQGELKSAETVAQRGHKQYPKEINLALELSEIAVARSDWTDAIQRWQIILDDYGENTPTKINIKIDNARRNLNSLEQKRFAERRLTYFRIKISKKYLYDLGLSNRALADLWEIYGQLNDPAQKLSVAWELALWYANQGGLEGAEKCLKLLPEILQDGKQPDKVRRAAVLAAECHGITGNKAAGQKVIQHALRFGPNADLFLAAANLETDITDRVHLINNALAITGLSPISYTPAPGRPAYDCLGPSSEMRQKADIPSSTQKVSIIVPAYNAQATIQTTIKSLLLQTWTNIEILVVDDCSKDDTVSIVSEYEKRDSRIRLFTPETNSGSFVARNIALKEALGTFVTCNDADDWAHPEKIETQVRHLIKNPAVIGNTSQQARTTPDLKIYRRGTPGFYIFSNMSSFLFRRKSLLEAVGFWDCVRFGGDSEFIWRVKKIFGEESIVNMKTGPLSLPRQTAGSLTGDSSFGYNGYFMGARKEYFDYFTYYHATAQNLHYNFPQKKRPFPVPEPLWPKPEDKPSGRRHFDVILISDFRLQDSTTISNIKEIKTHKKMGLRTGLFQMPCYGLDPNHPIDPEIRNLVDGEKVQVLVFGEKLSCDLLILAPLCILQEQQHFVPDVQANNVFVIVNQPPKVINKSEQAVEYDIHQCILNLKKYFGKTGTWYPFNPLVREALQQQIGDLDDIPLANEDWINFIAINDWSRFIQTL